VLRSRRKSKPQSQALPSFSPPVGLVEFKSARADDSIRVESLHEGNYASIDAKGGLMLPPPPAAASYGGAHGLPPPPSGYSATGGLTASMHSNSTYSTTGRDEHGAMVQVGRGYAAVPSEVSDSSAGAPPPFSPMGLPSAPLPYSALPSLAGTTELPTMQL